ncbi:ABC transporter permease [Streptomyces sp. Je 1-4]|uniref:ABC transporter permease n=1 Tax=Streptomyces TaxID=1883 RepID=UPI00140ECDA4|nr:MULTISPECIES: ABC transporter permease [unclassified Streptomyces]QIK06755.1 ABC transporter permease [Streptomyces sp. ID38640]UYB40117.1 ABC transporter permease [Streptomyces sp. Je 1-4]UZQ36207.1 ABC transporter permease [Streptomyces sp. Je 1-4] [Streptomyces sp. Je 1-4 4N24]UZQ43625.1 ABC transporter permease [Streptomyces sp. Je 1-4] [Streptomyces sp. Je 1-4 4N24_ara]
MTSPSQTAATKSDTPGLDSKGLKKTKDGKDGELVGRSPGQLMWRRFKRDRTGVICAVVVLGFFVVAALAPVIAKLYGKNPYTFYGNEDPSLFDEFGYPMGANGGISADFWFGIEPALGRDLFTSLLYGMRTSLGISVAVTILVVITGTLLGITAGYLGGRTDYWLGRVIDFLLAFPSQLTFVAFMPVVVAFFIPPGDETPTYVRVVALILVQWALGWMGLARLLRGQVLSLREREFVEAAKITGASPWRIIRKELLPNVVTPILVQATYMLPLFVTAEAGLSFLGVGIMEPTPDWGRLFHTAGMVYENDPTFLLFPGAAMVIFVLCFNLLGDSVRDAFDPKSGR